MLKLVKREAKKAVKVPHSSAFPYVIGATAIVAGLAMSGEAVLVEMAAAAVLLSGWVALGLEHTKDARALQTLSLSPGNTSRRDVRIIRAA